MGNFNDFMFSKSLDSLADKCVRNKVQIVEFVQWVEDEGQYLEDKIVEGWMGNVATGGLAGAGVGSMFGPMGTLAGAGMGALAGGAKSAYDYFAQPKANYNTTKQQAVEALKKFAQMSPRYAKMLGMMSNYVNKIQPNPDEGPAARRAGAAPAVDPATAAPPMAKPIPTGARGFAFIQGAKFIPREVIKVLMHNGIDAGKLNNVIVAKEREGKQPGEAVVIALGELGIKNMAGANYDLRQLMSLKRRDMVGVKST